MTPATTASGSGNGTAKGTGDWSDVDLERAFGRIEDLTRQVLVDVATLKTSLAGHQIADKEAFNIIGETSTTLRQQITNGLDKQDKQRRGLFVALNEKITNLEQKVDGIQADVNNAKGAWKVVAAILGVLSALMVGLTIAVATWLLHH